MTQGDDGNGRVSLARIDEKLNYAIRQIDGVAERQENALKDHEERLRVLEKNQTAIRTELNIRTGLVAVLASIGSALGVVIK